MQAIEGTSEGLSSDLDKAISLGTAVGSEGVGDSGLMAKVLLRSAARTAMAVGVGKLAKSMGVQPKSTMGKFIARYNQ